MLTSRALSAGRLTGLGATRGFTTGCWRRRVTRRGRGAAQEDVPAGTPPAAQLLRPALNGRKPRTCPPLNRPNGAGEGRRIRQMSATPLSGRRARRLPPRATLSAPSQTVLDEAGGIHVSPETARRLACDAATVAMRHGPDGEVLDVGRRTRTISPALRRALASRDRQCRFPGCQHRRCDGHHVRHWADGGATALDNLLLLCRRHHRAVHEERVQRDGRCRWGSPVRPAGRPPAPRGPAGAGLDRRAARARDGTARPMTTLRSAPTRPLPPGAASGWIVGIGPLGCYGGRGWMRRRPRAPRRHEPPSSRRARAARAASGSGSADTRASAAT